MILVPVYSVCVSVSVLTGHTHMQAPKLWVGGGRICWLYEAKWEGGVGKESGRWREDWRAGSDGLVDDLIDRSSQGGGAAVIRNGLAEKGGREGRKTRRWWWRVALRRVS